MAELLGMDGMVAEGLACSSLEIEVKPEDSVSAVGDRNEDGFEPRAAKGRGKSRAIGLSTRGRGSGRGRGRGKGSLPTSADMVCELCDFKASIVEFPPNQNKCYQCKGDWDSLARMSKRQKLEAWWQALQTKPRAEKRKVAKSFRIKFRALASPRERSKFALAEFIEIFKVTSASDVIDKNKMMWFEEAMEHWMSIKGGQLSRVEAEQAWADLLADPDHLSDDEGPAKAPKQLMVSKGRRVNKRATVERSQETRLSLSKKKFSEEDVQKMKKQCLSLGDETKASCSADIEGSIKALVNGGASGLPNPFGSHFAQGGAINVDLRHVGIVGDLAAMDEEGPAQEQNAGGQDEDDAGSAGADSGGASSAAWFDARAMQSRNVCTWKFGMATVERDLKVLT